jgi:hypothetical protein
VLSARAAPRNGYLIPHNRSQDQED